MRRKLYAVLLSTALVLGMAGCGKSSPESSQEARSSGQTAQEKTQIAVIEAIGADVKTVKAGQKILHDKYAGTSVKIDGEDYLILNIKDVLAVIE